MAGGSQVGPDRCGSHVAEVEGRVQCGKDGVLERSEAVARRVWVGGDGEMLVHPFGQAVLGASDQATGPVQLEREHRQERRSQRIAKRRAVDGAAQVVAAESLVQRHVAGSSGRPLGCAGLSSVDPPIGDSR